MGALSVMIVYHFMITIDSIDQLKVPDESIDLLMEIMDYYVDEMTVILFKTKKMIQSLSKI